MIKKTKKEYMKEYNQRPERKAQQKEYRERNKERIKELKRKYYIKNREKFCQRSAEYRLNNPEKIKEYRREYIKNSEAISKRKEYLERNKERLNKRKKIYMQGYYIKNREKISQYKSDIADKIRDWRREYNKKNKKRRNAYLNKKFKENPQLKIRSNLSRSFRHSVKKYMKDGTILKKNAKEINYKEIIENLEPFPENIKDYHLDHIVPLRVFDLAQKEHRKRAWNFQNLQFLRKEKNLEKGGILDFKKYPGQKEVYDKLRLWEILDINKIEGGEKICQTKNTL